MKDIDFSIVSDNCWGIGAYQALGIKYTSPIIDALIFTPEYFELVLHFWEYINKELQFIDPSESKYKELIGQQKFPVALLGKIELYFTHQDSSEEYITNIKERWKRRRDRLKQKILFKIGNQYLPQGYWINCDDHTDVYIKTLHRLWDMKIISFTVNPLHIQNNFVIREYHYFDAGQLGRDFEQYLSWEQLCAL